MRVVSLTSFLLLLTTLVAAQTPSSQPAAAPIPPLPKEPAEIFAAAGALYDLASPALKPWHMKVSYQLYDDQGKPGGQGSYEYWWASPDTYRSTWTRPGMEHTDWHVKGQHFSAGTGEPLEFFERKIQSDLLAPLPKARDLDPEKVRFDRQQQDFGTLKLPCVMVIHKMPLHGQVQVVPMGMFPTYCFDPQHPILRAYYAFGSTSVIYNSLARFQGVYLAKKVSILDGQKKVLDATVDSVETASAEMPELTPSTDAKKEGQAQRVTVSSEIEKAMLIKSVRPIYPQDAKEAWISGKVTLHALIGTDGRLHDLSVIDGPSPSLISAAMLAVSQWEYKPYLLNGKPVEVDTTIDMFFYLGN
jgi:TonB family protein